MTSLLVFGRTGQVARELSRLAPAGSMFMGRDAFDLALRDPAEAIAAVQPSAVINAAGYTAVDAAETDLKLAMRLNADAPGQMARACTDLQIPFVHISSDYVFGGDKHGAYLETDPPAPHTAYGRSKAEGETQVAAALGDSAILRTSWVFSSHGSNFLKTMLRLAETRREIGVVHDQIGRPTWARDVADAALKSVGRLADGPLGTLHTAGDEVMSWADFAEKIFQQAAAKGMAWAQVRPIPTAQYPTPARRPANSNLAGGDVEAVLGWRPTPLNLALSACLDELETAS